MYEEELKSKIEFVRKMRSENPRAFEFLAKRAKDILKRIEQEHLRCAQCGTNCNSDISFNWNDGIRYLCSEKCVEKSKHWRLKGIEEMWVLNG